MKMAKTEKTDNWDNLIALMKERDRHFKGKKRHIDHDLIAHGVSRNGKKLKGHGKHRKK